MLIFDLYYKLLLILNKLVTLLVMASLGNSKFSVNFTSISYPAKNKILILRVIQNNISLPDKEELLLLAGSSGRFSSALGGGGTGLSSALGGTGGGANPGSKYMSSSSSSPNPGSKSGNMLYCWVVN